MSAERENQCDANAARAVDATTTTTGNTEAPLPSATAAGAQDDYREIAEMMPEYINGSSTCPLCGRTGMHTHPPTEIVIYRNGLKYGRNLIGVSELEATIDALRAELDGLRVRTRTAEGDADRLAGTLAGIHQPRLSLHPRDCGCGTHLALEAHASAFARRVAGETGDTP